MVLHLLWRKHGSDEYEKLEGLSDAPPWWAAKGNHGMQHAPLMQSEVVVIMSDHDTPFGTPEGELLFICGATKGHC
jgi:hypothetical protein